MYWFFSLSLSHCFKKSLFEDVLTPLSIHDSVWTWGIYCSTHIFFRGQTIFQMSQTIRWMIHQEKKTFSPVVLCPFLSFLQNFSLLFLFFLDWNCFKAFVFPYRCTKVHLLTVCSALVATLYCITLTYSPLLDVLKPSAQLLNLLAFVHLKNVLAAISLNVGPFW